MERGLKERLVGAAVLVALAVVFIPMLLDESPRQPDPLTESNIPERPNGEDGFSSRIIPAEPEPVDVVPPPEPELPEADTTAEADVPAASGESDVSAEAVADPPVESAPEPEPEAAAEQEQDPEPEAVPPEAESQPQQSESRPEPKAKEDLSGWVVQLDSFAQEENARGLDDKLRESGYASFVEPVTQSGKTVYRVRVGPEIKRSEAEKILKEIKARFELQGIVVSYP